MAKFIFMTGGVVSGLGKGVSLASIGSLLKDQGYSVFVQKFDPYLNIDPGTMNPNQHGEVFVTKDGGETDLDLGHYERLIGINTSKRSSLTSGKVYKDILEKERKGEFPGQTIQIVPHIVNAIKQKVFEAEKTEKADFILTEIGGTVGDMESQAYLETIRIIKNERPNDVLSFHCTLIPYLHTSKELKTKPTQHSVSTLRSSGINPDFIICRSEHSITTSIKKKISEMCGINPQNVIDAKDQNIYNIPISFSDQKVDQNIFKFFKIKPKHKLDLSKWKNYIKLQENATELVKIAIVGKYPDNIDSYLSVVESLQHSIYNMGKLPSIEIIGAEKVEKNIKILDKFNGILIPGGFGNSGTNGKLKAIQYARENNKVFFGICYGMQLSLVEYAKNVLDLKDANSTEINPKTKNPIIIMQEDKKGLEIGGTMRLGDEKIKVERKSKAHQLYGKTSISERHRHRYCFNNKFLKKMEKDIIFSGKSAEGYAEIIENKNCDYFVACQFHPEFNSRFFNTHPLFDGFIKAAINSIK